MSPVDPRELLPLFGAGDLVANRYRVLRPLGHGAMGEVYAAIDLQLGGEIALKVLRTAALGDARAVERFKREVLLARRITHPNVCRLFDLGVHLAETDGSTAQPVLFLTMELLPGKTLVAWIEENGPLTEVQATAIACQLAGALDAAHRAGVIHRDFKSSNILLVPLPDGALRAVVTDFGLARASGGDANDGATLTQAGGMLGTPAYMAPEQVEGKPATGRSDLFAFGVVLYEMVTGELPFDGESPLSMAVKRLREPPRPIEALRPDLSPRFRAVARRCLARDPAARFADPLEVEAALSGSAPVRTAHEAWRWLGRWGGIAAAAGLLLALVLTWSVRHGEPPPHGAAADAVAVLGLRNATGDAAVAWMSVALPEMLTTELGAEGGVRTVPGELVADTLIDLGLARDQPPPAEALSRLRAHLGATTLVTGTFVALDEQGGRRLRLDLRTLPGGGREAGPLSVEGAEGELFALVARAGADLRRALGIPARAGEAGREAARATQPANTEAMRWHAEGLDRLWSGDPAAARTRFEQALEADPAFALAWAGLASAWRELGYDARALAAAEAAWRLGVGLPRDEALLIEGAYRRAANDWDRALEIFELLRRERPGDPERALLLAQVQLEAARAADAAATLREVADGAGALDRANPRVALLAARAAEGLSDFRGQLAFAETALAGAERLGARGLTARAHLERGVALRKLGRTAESRRALLSAQAAARTAADRATEGRTLQALANLERGEGRFEEAAARFGEARALFAEIGNRSGEARAELSQGLVLSERGDLEGALALYESALVKLREVGDRRAVAVAQSNIGTMLFNRGDLVGAEARHRDALAEFRELGDAARVVISLLNLAPIRLEACDLGGARAASQEALETARASGDLRGQGYSHSALGQVAFEAGDFAEAIRQQEAAHARFAAAGLLPALRAADVALALARAESGESSAALVELARLVEEQERAKEGGELLLTELERARLLLGAGRVDEARRAGERLLPEAAGSASSLAQHRGLLLRGELAYAASDSATARLALASATEVAERGGFRLRALEAALVRAAGEGDGAAAAAVAASARDLGCGRLAQRAGAIARRVQQRTSAG